MTPDVLRELEARGLRLVPVGGRPPKTARDVAVLLAERWFAAGALSKRPKNGQAVVELWQSQGYPGLTDPAHVVARKKKALAAVGMDHTLLTFRGEGSTRSRVGEGALVLLAPRESLTEDGEGSLRFHGPVWSWVFGDETAEHYDATGVIEYRSKS